MFNLECANLNNVDLYNHMNCIFYLKYQRPVENDYFGIMKINTTHIYILSIIYTFLQIRDYLPNYVIFFTSLPSFSTH